MKFIKNYGFFVAVLLAIGILAALPSKLLAQASSSASVAKTIGQIATINWTAPTTYATGAAITAGTAITYDVFTSTITTGTTCNMSSTTLVTSIALTTTSYVTPAYTAPGLYCYTVTAIIAGAMSVPSNTVSALVSEGAPNPPAATIE